MAEGRFGGDGEDGGVGRMSRSVLLANRSILGGAEDGFRKADDARVVSIFGSSLLTGSAMYEQDKG
jgi:hypothetical protein